ncbi:MAG: imidazole glycerol phosphate synthase subunit HisH [Pigmentiphaga sp.]|uniref:imidazole glycerol phosphate synthase subunit HisH n=1 Tax=Pigmentiphaga sp. TaxID=1977564 RepID=UPI003B577037
MATANIVIVNYGAGNLASVSNMISRVGGESTITDDLRLIDRASKIVLPGVGAFDYGMSQLKNKGIAEALQRRASEGTPILGICLGMQLLSKGSEEGSQEGLNLIDAFFRKFNTSKVRVPHVGWNTIKVEKQNQLLDSSRSELRFYFVHSYYAECQNPEDVLCTTTYDVNFVSGYSHGNIFGFQFHPEKSHKFGMNLFSRFMEI